MAATTDTYPIPLLPLKTICCSCGLPAGGHVRGSSNFRYLLKAIKEHEDGFHPPYNRDQIIPELIWAVEKINDGHRDDPRHVGRYLVQPW